MKCYSKTDIGTVREENQDRINVIELCENTFAAIVCDGMGGENAGSEASETAVTVISNIISRGFRKGADENSLRNLLISAVSTANAIVYEKSRLHEEMRGMGTTCVAAIFCEDNAHIVNVGDSRAYFIADGEISQITIDHTIVMDMYSKGDIKKGEYELIEKFKKLKVPVILAINKIDMSVDHVLDIAKTITTIKIKLPKNGTFFTLRRVDA